jgi:HK97 family phage portal protein
LASELARRTGLVERVAAAQPRPSWYSWQISEAAPATRALTPGQIPERAGFVYGIPRGGLNEINAGIGASTQTDRRSSLQQLYESFLACPWAWACVQAIARTITAGGLFMDWDSDTGEGDQEAPDKPEPVLAAERLIKYTNARQNIRQLMRNVVIDLLVFGDAYIEITWWAGTPVALYNLDVPTTTPVTDEHGNVTAYKQVTDQGQTADFKPEDVIHISLDAPRSGVFGVSPTQAALLPITSWLFAAATQKEMFRKGLPATVHADFPAGVPKGDQETWVAQVMARNVGPRNIGRPWVTKGGATLKELQAGKVADTITALSQKRDEIIASYGVPPAKVSIIESGNLGGGTGEEQDITYKVDVCGPIAELVLEAFNFQVIQGGFGVQDWQARFRDVDYRSSKVRDDIRDQRVRNGTWTINKARADIGEPPVEGGNDPVIIDRQNLVLVKDLAAMSKATVDKQAAAGLAATAPGAPPGGETPDGSQPPGAPQDDPSGSGQDNGQTGEAISPAILARYRARLAEAQRAIALTEATSQDPGDAVYSQLAENFPAGSVKWVKDSAWTGPTRVPLDEIDTRDRDQWDASRPQDKPQIEKLRAKLRKKLARGARPKPIILVRWPGADKWVIVDGHHRFAAAELEEQAWAWAYMGRVESEKGPWLTMAASEDRKGKAA